MKQTNNNPAKVEIEITVLWALKHGFFADIEVSKITAAKAALESFFTATKSALLEKIIQKGAFDDALDAEMEAACREWRKTFA